MAAINPTPIEGNNVYRLVISSLTNDDFEDNMGVLFGINVVAGEDFEGGDIVLSNISMSNKAAARFDVKESLIVKCTGASAGINQVETTDTDVVDGIYNVAGVKSAKLNQGINIVVKNGKAVKVFK